VIDDKREPQDKTLTFSDGGFNSGKYFETSTS